MPPTVRALPFKLHSDQRRRASHLDRRARMWDPIFYPSNALSCVWLVPADVLEAMRREGRMLKVASGGMPISASRTPQKVQAGKRTVRMTARVRAAIETMVWQGLKRDEAAKAAVMKDNSLYVAL